MKHGHSRTGSVPVSNTDQQTNSSNMLNYMLEMPDGDCLYLNSKFMSNMIHDLSNRDELVEVCNVSLLFLVIFMNIRCLHKDFTFMIYTYFMGNFQIAKFDGQSG